VVGLIGGQEQAPLTPEKETHPRPPRVLAATGNPHEVAPRAEVVELLGIERLQAEREQISFPDNARSRNPAHCLQEADQGTRACVPFDWVEVLPPGQKVRISIDAHRFDLPAEERERGTMNALQVAPVAEFEDRWTCRRRLGWLAGRNVTRYNLTALGESFQGPVEPIGRPGIARSESLPGKGAMGTEYPPKECATSIVYVLFRTSSANRQAVVLGMLCQDVARAWPKVQAHKPAR
jgi:hypothetical protein